METRLFKFYSCFILDNLILFKTYCTLTAHLCTPLYISVKYVADSLHALTCHANWVPCYFCQDQPKMEQREPAGDHFAEGAEGSLKQLASKWFIETQVPLIVNNGLFPSWFLGFISRQESEEILREKELGSFLIRLSDKTIGYILSYKGQDRCRHFVISQRETGHFAVCGDTEEHYSIPELLEYYKTSPIEPFGEYLTSSCFEVGLEAFELYDIIQVSPKQNRIFAVKVKKAQRDLAAETQPTRPPKSNRTQEVSSLHYSTTSDHNGILYAQLRKQTPRDANGSQQLSLNILPHANSRKSGSATSVEQSSSSLNPGSLYSELSLLDTKSKSLPQLVSSSDREQSHRLTAPPQTPPRLSPKLIRQAGSCSPQPSRTEDGPKNSSSNPDCTSDTVIYHLVGRPENRSPTTSHYRTTTPELDDKNVYAEVTSEVPDNTYESLPGHTEPVKPEHNTYVPVEDKRRKQNYNSWGTKNDKWKWFFTDGKKKH
uniref:SH2 domain-containing protein n=1 Tax=Oryzias latipes TaxID=8090 RepID=H2LT89_ORYLA